MNVELTTMCCILDKKRERVLMINREKSWKGMAFPGGHLENGESITECIRREIREETGLEMLSLRCKGMTYFYNTDNYEKHIIWNYLCDDFTGTVKKSCNEGSLIWVQLNELKEIPFAEGMELRLDLFLKPGFFEYYVRWDEKSGYTRTETIRID